MMSVRIRVAESRDRKAIREVHLRAFPESENQSVATLAADLLDDRTEPETISLVAEVGGSVVGHIAFSPVTTDANKNWLGYLLAPLGVAPGHQGVGIGSRLIEDGMARLTTGRADAIFVYGDPAFYGRFGFSTVAATRFVPPYELQYPFGWQARVLHEGGTTDPPFRLSCVPALCDPALW
jgi:putative acetyltransferase